MKSLLFTHLENQQTADSALTCWRSFGLNIHSVKKRSCQCNVDEWLISLLWLHTQGEELKERLFWPRVWWYSPPQWMTVGDGSRSTKLFAPYLRGPGKREGMQRGIRLTLFIFLLLSQPSAWMMPATPRMSLSSSQVKPSWNAPTDSPRGVPISINHHSMPLAGPWGRRWSS